MLLINMFFFWKSSFLAERPASKKYVFQTITYSEKVAPPKQHLYWKELIFK